MAKITKKVDRGIPYSYRSQQFTNPDAKAGDVLMIQDSLGFPASHIVIETHGGSGMAVKFNVYQTVFPNRPLDMLRADHLPFVASGIEYYDDNAARIEIEKDTTFELDGVIIVKDIEVVAASGQQWAVFVS